jgi:AraC-like DNA-binding protein
MNMEQSTSIATTREAASPLDALLPNGAAARLLDAPSPALTPNQTRPRPRWWLRKWQLRTHEAFTPDAAPPQCGLEPPSDWAPAAHQLTDLARIPVAAPSWWASSAGFVGNIETWTGSTSTDRLNRPDISGRRSLRLQLSLAGWGHFQVRGETPQRLDPGKAIIRLVPSRDRCYLPEESPGWTFAWIGIHHPYLRDRLATRLASIGPIIDMPPDAALTASALRLVRGAIKKDFRDQFEAETALFEFVLSFERWVLKARECASDDHQLMDEVRSHIVAKLPKAISVCSLASEFGMSRSHFSHFFRARTGLTPAHFATEVRVQIAALMLTETAAPLKAIADACGFANANHLCKVFRRIRHLSPASFRQVAR